MRVALDSNILVYLAGSDRLPEDAVKARKLYALMERITGRVDLVVPLQVIGETYSVLRRGRTDPGEARALVLSLTNGAEKAVADQSTFAAALDLAVRHRLQFWDALIVSTAAAAGCAMLLSEDMQHGFAVGGVTIVDPLAAARHPLLAALVD